ncbi:MAG: DUF4252 domain-containing protein [Bacillota bacterium]
MKTSTKFKTTLKLLAFMLLLALSSTLQAQNKDYKNEPGFFDFGDLSAFDTGDRITEVTLDEQLLKMASGFSKDNKNLNTLMNGLKLIKVNTFAVNNKNKDQILSKIKSFDDDLIVKKWNRIVKTRSSNENINVYAKTGSSGQIIGLVVTNFFRKKGEASFINIIGNIDMDAMSGLSEQFQIPSLNNLKHHKNK